jgi:hypothetical protein
MTNGVAPGNSYSSSTLEHSQILITESGNGLKLDLEARNRKQNGLQNESLSTTSLLDEDYDQVPQQLEVNLFCC